MSTLNITRNIFYDKAFRTMNHEVTSSQLMRLLKAISDCEKFSAFTQLDRLSKEPDTTRNNLLRASLFDKETEHISDENHIISSLLQAYKRHYQKRRTLILF